MENIKLNAVYDIPDERDYRYDTIFWIQKTYPRKYIMDKWIYQNQWLEEITKMMCVFYSTAHWNNEQNIIEWSKVRINWKDFWLQAKENKLLNPKKWALLKNWPAFAKTLKYISWYSLVQELEEIKDSIINNRPIVVWTNKANWKTTRKVPYTLELWTSYWHAFVIVWYDDDYEWWCLICKNSYWKEVYDNWKFYIRYSDFKEILFYSKYSLIDEIDPILIYKKNIMENINIPMAKVWFELWIWNWKDATEEITREKCVTVVLRAIEKFEKWEINAEMIEKLLTEIK